MCKTDKTVEGIGKRGHRVIILLQPHFLGTESWLLSVQLSLHIPLPQPMSYPQKNKENPCLPHEHLRLEWPQLNLECYVSGFLQVGP